mgnify:CR=1 FL=1
MALVGYARVSTVDQNLGRQIEAIDEVGRMFVNKSPGKDLHPPQLDAPRAYVREGVNGVVRVNSVGHLVRSMQDLHALLQEFDTKGLSVDFIYVPALSTFTRSGKFSLIVLAAVAESVRELIREPQGEGIALAEVKGKYKRGAKLSPEQVEEKRQLVGVGISKTRVLNRLGVSRWSLNDALVGRCLRSCVSDQMARSD